MSVSDLSKISSRNTPPVAEVAVVGIPDPRWGEAIYVFITRRTGADDGLVLEDALDRLCRAELAAYKAPKQDVFLDELPKTTTGEIRKIELREVVAEN